MGGILGNGQLGSVEKRLGPRILGRNGGNLASFSFRLPPRPSWCGGFACVLNILFVWYWYFHGEGGGGCGNGKLGSVKIRLKVLKLGAEWRKFSFRQLPSAPAAKWVRWFRVCSEYSFLFGIGVFAGEGSFFGN